MASSRPMSDHVSCGVCMEQYNRSDHIPKILPCQHTFCLACLLSLERSSSSMSIECPMCRNQHEGSPHDFTTNRVAMDIAEELQQQASPSQTFRSQQAPRSLSCSAHPDIESVLVCVDCLAGICSKCVKKHIDHQLEDMHDAKTLLRERFVDATRTQLSLQKTEMASALSVREITRAEDDIKEMCALLISVITEWQNDQLSIVGKIKTKAAKREQKMKAQMAKIEAMFQNDIDISTLIRDLTKNETLSSQTLKRNTYNFVTARQTMLADLTSVITAENLVNSKFLQEQTPKATSIATSPNQSPHQDPAPQNPAGASAGRTDNQAGNVFRSKWHAFMCACTHGLLGFKQQPKEPAYSPKEKLQTVIHDNREVPAYWRKNTNPWTVGFDAQNSLVYVDVKTYAAIEQLVKGSWVQNCVGQGAASVGCGHISIRVQAVQRIENPSVYQRYRLELKRACQEALKSNYPAITSINNEPEILTATLNIPELEAIRLREVNEYLLFCGVPNGEMSNVVRRYYDKSGVFGSGLYLSESSTIADQYADKPTARVRTGDPLYMVVYRAILGNIYHQKGWAAHCRPPCRYRSCRNDQCSHCDRYDSVLGTENDGGERLNFRDFVLFDDKHYYPEFLVTYTRL